MLSLVLSYGWNLGQSTSLVDRERHPAIRIRDPLAPVKSI
jgi:hypothetical protein